MLRKAYLAVLMDLSVGVSHNLDVTRSEEMCRMSRIVYNVGEGSPLCHHHRHHHHRRGGGGSIYLVEGSPL